MSPHRSGVTGWKSRDVMSSAILALLACKDLAMAEAQFQIRPAEERDRLPLAQVFAAVAEERDGIATEPPFDIEQRAASFTLEGTFVAVADGEVIGSIHVDASRHGF